MSLLSGRHALTTSWDDLLWSAITVGRPNRQFVFQHGTASVYEALFRLSLIRMALEQAGQHGWRLRRTNAARTLDPTEKGAVSYFVGLAVCKLFAAKLLDAPWMLHLDVFRPALDVQLSARSRPDLVGQTRAGQWIALECKGRISAPDKKTIERAKQQAKRVVSVSGTAPSYHIGGFAFFKNDVLEFCWLDPDPEPEIRNPISVQPTSDTWREYYRPVLELVRSRQTYFAQMHEEPVLMPVEEADIKIGIEPSVLRHLDIGQWDGAREAAQATRPSEISYQVDGIAVVAGPSWLERYADVER